MSWAQLAEIFEGHLLSKANAIIDSRGHPLVEEFEMLLCESLFKCNKEKLFLSYDVVLDNGSPAH